MKLFGDHADTRDEAKLTVLLQDALRQQPAILLAFVLQVASKACDNSRADAHASMQRRPHPSQGH